MTKSPFNQFGSITILGLIVISLFFASCQKERRAQPLPPEVSSYVNAFTSGIVSRTNPVIVQFTQAVASPEAVGQEAPAALFKISPAVKGRLSWEDDHTLRFDPEQPMASGTVYVVTVNLQEIIQDVPVGARSFEFDFQTKNQFIELQLAELYAPNPRELSKQELQGYIFTADFAENEAIEKTLAAVQSGNTLNIRWTHSADGQEHQFIVEQISRGDQAGKVQISCKGKPIGVNLQEERTIEIPALSDFLVTEAKMVQGDESYVRLRFSDPLQADQQVEGLVYIDQYSGALRYLINGQELRLYPQAPLAAGQLTIRVNPGIRNINGSRMEKAGQWKITVNDITPQVRLAGRGVILPNSEGLMFPFEAIGLTDVDVEIFKIFHNNILQFLQSTRLDGNSYDLQSVGRIVLQKKVSLSSLNPAGRATEWTRYALDLSKFINQDPEAIYQIRIGFRPEYATYACPGGVVAAAELESGEEDYYYDEYGEGEADEEGPQSIMTFWYGSQGYYPGYRWEHRDNPCYPAYYNSDRFVQRNVFASNLGLIVKGGSDNSFLVAVTDLRTSAPISGATVALYDFQQQPIGSATTDSRGLIRIKTERRPFVAMATAGNQKGYLRLQDPDALPLSRFDVDGTATRKGLKGYLYGERGVWRPGDSVFLNFVLDDRYDQLPVDYPITFELYDPRGRLQEKRTTSRNVGSIYPLAFATARDAPTGNWSARVKTGGATFSRVIQIETVKPNRLKIDLQFGMDELKANAEPLRGELQVNWLHGAPARGLEARVEATLRADKTSFDKYPNYVFNDPARAFYGEPQTIFEGPLNEAGRTSFDASLGGSRQAPGRLIASIRSRAFERGGDFSTDYLTLPYHPFEAYTGLLIPENKYGEKRTEIKQNNDLSFVAVDTKGNPLPNRRLSIGVYRVEWRWWWDQDGDNVSRYNSSNHFNALFAPVSVTTNSQGQADWNLSFDEWGRYLIRVCDTESGHCSGDFVYAGHPWYGDDNLNREAAAMINFKSDKESYEVGETVKLTIPMGQKGRALVTLENGTRVIDAFWAEAKEGENTYSFKATAEMTPTVYAYVTLVQPHAQALNDLPIRLYGVIPVTVEDPGSHLEPEIKMPEVLAPEQTVTVEVAEKSGRPMAYTVAMVDEGLLGLTRFQTPNPHHEFYGREALGVRTWDLYDQVLGAYGGELERILSIGGAADLRPEAADQRANRFKPVVLTLGPFYLKKNDRAKHQFTLPNYVGAVRTMVVAADGRAYGSVDKTTPVRQPLMVLATLPRTLGPGEELQLPVTVFAMEDQVKEVAVQVTENSGLVTFTGPRNKTIRFSKPGERLVDFDIKVAKNVGVARFAVTATSGSLTTHQEIEIQVRNPNPMQTEVLAHVLAPSESWQQSFSPLGMTGTNEVMVEVSSIPPLNLGQRLDYLLTYPYGCIEQTISSGFPQLYVHRLLKLDDRQKQVARTNVEATIGRLKQFMTEQGGFAYWPGQTTPDPWSTTYGGHFMLEAEATGYTLPAGLLNRWIDYQKKAARLWSPQLMAYGFTSQGHELDQAYRLYTLALARQPDLSAMNRLRESPNLALAARWRLAAAYAVAGKTEVAKQLITNLPAEVPQYRELSYTYGSNLRDLAMIMETAVLVGEETRAAELLQSISDQMGSSGWWSTQTVAYCLLAVSKYLGEGALFDTFQFNYQLDGATAVNAGSDSPVMQIEVPANDGRDHRVALKNNSQSKLFARIIRRGQPVTGAETASANDLKIEVLYRNTDGSLLNPVNLTQGQDFVAEVRISHPGTRPVAYREMALDQIFPSGWEILNSRMGSLGEDSEGSSAYDYQDVRDDRVNTFFDINPGNSVLYRVQLTAAYRGRFYLPAVACEAMYDRSINARLPGKWVEVTRPGEI